MLWPSNTSRLSRRYQAITTIDAHAAGEPLRIITSGLPDIPGPSMLERRRWFRENLDHLRQALMHEPRGHRDMYGCVVTPPVSNEADIGVLFMHNEGYSTMCGHGIIALVTAIFETGAMPAKGNVTLIAIDTPAGLVRATAHIGENNCVERVSFTNVPSFILQQDLRITVAKLGSLSVDIAFGGAFYAVLPVESIGLELNVGNLPSLVMAAESIKQAINDTITIQHPLESDLGFLYGVILTGPPEDTSHHSRNLCVFANAEVDRSPTGTGVSARLAVHHAKNEIQTGQSIVVESILGRSSTFRGRVIGIANVGNHDAIIPEITGQAFITGRHEFFLTPDDILGQGFCL